MTRSRRGGILLTVAALLTSGLSLVGLATAPAQAAWSAPGFVRTIGGTGRPGIFPWGVQYNPVSNEVIVGDYLNFQIRRYTPDGKLLGSFYRENHTGQPYSIGVDPRNGDIYVPEITDGGVSNRVARYTKDGTYVSELTLPGINYHAWISIDGRGNLIQADSHVGNDAADPPAVRVWRLSDGAPVQSFEVLPPGTTSTTIPRIYGIDTDVAGNFWLTDTFNNRILKYSAAGTFVAAYGTGRLHGDARGMALDEAHNRLYVSDPSVGRVKVFDLQGRFLEDLGTGPGAGPGDLGAARQPAVAPDGSVYVAEYGNARVHRFSLEGDDEGFFPRPPQPAVPGQLGEPRDVDVDDVTGDVWVADSWNQRFQKFTATGEFAGTWGSRGSDRQYGMNYPRGIAIDPVSRRVWVVNQRGHHIKRYEYDGTYVDTLGSVARDSSDPGSFRWPLDVEFDRGRAVVTDRRSPLVKLLTASTGAETGTIRRSPNHAVAIDPDTGHIFVAGHTHITEYTASGTKLGSFGGPGTADGQFQHIWDLVISKGVLYATDDSMSRIQAFTTSGTFLGKWGGFGAGAYQFNNPSGIATDAKGLLYVADARNDRIVVFDPARARSGSAPAPDVTLAQPGNGATVPAEPVRFAGTATDETGIASVQVAVQDRTTGTWFNASNSTWTSTQTWANSPVVGASTKDMTWAWTFVGLEYGGRYSVRVRSVDAAGLTSPTRSADFDVVSADATDTTGPTLGDLQPAVDAIVPPTGADIRGRATDDRAVATVQVAIKDRTTNTWLRVDGTWGPFAWLPATLAVPGSSSTTWTRTWPSATGSYGYQLRASDASGNTTTGAFRPFTVN